MATSSHHIKRIVLLVDDDVEDHEFFKFFLSHFQHNITVLSAFTADNALRLLSSKQPQIIFLDINMPKLSGIELLQKIKSITRYTDIPIYMYSTSDGYQSKPVALAAGAAGYFRKPSSLKEFESIFCEVLN